MSKFHKAFPALLACLFLSLPMLLASPAPPASSPGPTRLNDAGRLDDAARHNNLGVAYMNQQLGEQALAQFKQATTADKSLGIPHLNAGIVLLTLQRLDEATAELQLATKMDPVDPRAWYNLGLLERGKGNCTDSIPAFDQVLKIDPASADAHYFLGSCYAERKDFPRAIDEYHAALHLNPMHPSSEFGLARALQRSGHTDEAREHLKRFEHLTHEKLASVLALTYGDQGAYSLAEEIKSTAADVGPMIPITFAATELAAKASKNSAATNATLSGGMCLLDPDGHGQPDLLVLGDGSPAVTYYRHSNSGGFEPASAQKLGLTAAGHAISCAIGDFDNDGLPDIALAVTDKALGDRILLYRNTGKGTFEDVTLAVGIRQLNHPAGLTFVDYDHDGDVDLFVTGSPLDSKIYKTATPPTTNILWRNNGNTTFTEWTAPTGFEGTGSTVTAMLSDLNNDRAVDLVVAGQEDGVTLYMNPREGKFPALPLYPKADLPPAIGLAILDYNKDGWMDIAVTHAGAPGITLWKNIDGKRFERVPLPLPDVKRAWGITPVDLDNDGWIDLAAVVETGPETTNGTSPRSEVRVLRNMGSKGFIDVSKQLKLGNAGNARSILAVDADGDGDADLLVSTVDARPRLLRNDGGNRNHSVQIVLHGFADNKMGIGTRVELFAGGLWQKWEMAGGSGYLGQGANSILAGLGDTTEPVIVRTLWPTGVPQDELNVAAKGSEEVKELDRRGSSCPVVFAWDGSHYQFITDTIGAAVIGHWVSPYARNIPDPDEWIKVDGSRLKPRNGYLSLRIGEPMEEVNFIDQVRLIAVDHPSGTDVFPNERFNNDPPFPEQKTIFTRDAHPLLSAVDNNGNDALQLLSARDHHFVRDFANLPYAGFAKPHSLTIDIGPWSAARPLRLLMSGFIEYFSASSLYSAWQAGLTPISPYIEAQLADGSWQRVVEDMGFPAGLPRTIITDLTGKLPAGATRLRITTNLQIYWDQVLVSNETDHPELIHETELPLAAGTLGFRGYPKQIDGDTPGDLTYAYDEASATGPFIRQRGPYTRYGKVTPLLTSVDNQLVVFGSGEDIDLEFRESTLPPLPAGWKRDYFFYANGYVKDMDYYEAMPFTVADLPFHGMSGYPYAGTEHFPDDATSLDYQINWNDRYETGKPIHPYRFNYAPRHAVPEQP